MYNADDDVKVPILIKAPYLLKPGSSMEDEVTTTQIAPTILSLLGLEPSKLKVRAAAALMMHQTERSSHKALERMLFS